MTGNLKADPDALRATAPRFRSVGDGVATAAQRLRAVIEAEGACWGGDEIGKAFGDGYTPGATEGQEAIQGLSAVFTRMGDNVVVVADSLQAQDEAISSGINAAAT
ncbi:WXG100 family type VII secretion target [Nocardia cyriacigeorgica]|nr:WXG100 family type VII secretion target [Nocardia cyriacigeorgica]MBF6289197.1 WXG100 family type VII secretion target [Nocardia cyriacigeorgica]MBF6425645.1 WXG100 family type VII secretion target [Nocardia cyriacigeorgica]BDT85147.1 hypothetical protein FMUAM8_09110 [Nocardia cyriacigeorgica]